MQATRGSPAAFWNSRQFEWSLVLAVLLCVGGFAARQYRQLEGLGEYGAIQSTLGNMRTALLLDYLQRLAANRPPAAPGREQNPFVLLSMSVGSYAGVVPMSQQTEVAPGSWMFDERCVCVGYRPLHPQWLEPIPGPAALWFRLTTRGGLVQVTAMQHYRWQSQPID